MQRAEQEIGIITEISQILSANLQLEEVFQRAMQVLAARISVQRASLVLEDPASEQVRIAASIGLTPAEQERGRYDKGEGVTGRVLQTGEAAVVPDLGKDADFLNRTGARPMRESVGAADPAAAGRPLSFVCVPLKDADRTIGAISIDRPFVDDAQLAADARLMHVISGLFSQAVRTFNQVRLEKEQWVQETAVLRDNLRETYRFDNIIGTSPAMTEVLSTIGQVADSRATVLLLGETGCGKELMAKAIHFNSPRRDKPLIRINCGALSPQLLESELFGHVEGAFTGAVRDKVGRFEAANGGTIFLDEIGTLSPELQVKLLRVLQEREVERVGDHKPIRLDCRVIAATNLGLEDEVAKGTFREDLYYRLNVVTVHLPPLRKRREDIPLLIDHFLDKYNRENQRSVRQISRDTMATLMRFPWPGNIRELENAVERAVVLSSGEELNADLLPLPVRMFAQQVRGGGEGGSFETTSARLAELALERFGDAEGEVYEHTVHQIERDLIAVALRQHGGVKTRTADFLGINRNTLNKKVRELNINGGGAAGGGSGGGSGGGA